VVDWNTGGTKGLMEHARVVWSGLNIYVCVGAWVWDVFIWSGGGGARPHST